MVERGADEARARAAALAAPFALEAAGGGGGWGCLMIHGFTGAPCHLRPLAERLHAAGFSVEAPLLPGHGERPERLNLVTLDDWLAALDEALERLRARCARLVLIGLSMGGLLALRLAIARGAQVDALVVMGAPLRLGLKSRLGVSLYRGLGRPRWMRLIPKTARAATLTEAFDPDDPSYDVFPMNGVLEMERLRRWVDARLHRVWQPTLVIQGALDPTVHVDSSLALIRRISARRSRLVMLRRSLHVLPLDVDAPLLEQEVMAFLAGLD